MIEKTKHIPDAKESLKKLDVIEYLKPKKLYYPVTNARCAVADISVSDDNEVKVGEVLGIRNGTFFVQPIHSTVSGKFVGKERHFGNNGKMVEYLVVENNFKDELHPSIVERKDEVINKLTQDEFVEIMKNKALVGLGGGGFPTYVKFETKEKIDVIIGNGVECELNLVSDYYTMKNKTRDMLQGLVYAMKTVNAPKGVIVIAKKNIDLLKVINECITNSFDDHDITVKVVSDSFAQGWELTVIKNALGKKIPVGKVPSKYGIINVNVNTLLSIYDAVKKNLPVLTRHFVISGNGIKNAAFKVKLGTPIKELIGQTGGLIDDGKNKVLIIGGQMMGTSVINDDLMMTHTMTSLIVLNEENVKEQTCLGCGSCVYSCPVGLLPVQIMKGYKKKDKEMLADLKVKDCMECGLCAYTCPSKIQLTDIMRQSKRLVK